ncbi:MAG: hypothetical protein NTU47_03410 [Ignavibacteriales bacterium]|nr:hypothetical protein [Ignavibacteriales bacterium]
MIMSSVRSILVLSIVATNLLSGQVFMNADSTGDAYARIVSKKYGYEVPDCKHAGRHITEA